MLKIGVICEGPTDFVAIRSFGLSSLSAHEIKAEFKSILPEPDNTAAVGWASVLFWLRNNPFLTRSETYLTSGLFEGSEVFDILIIQMDSDILNETGFVSFLAGSDEFSGWGPIDTNIQRGEQTRKILRDFANDNSQLSQCEDDKHVFVAAVESTEAWCIACGSRSPSSPESLDSAELTNLFGQLLATVTGNPIKETYEKINKKVRTRKTLCELIADGPKIEQCCPSFKLMVDQMVNHVDS